MNTGQLRGIKEGTRKAVHAANDRGSEFTGILAGWGEVKIRAGAPTHLIALEGHPIEGKLPVKKGEKQ